MHHKELEFLNNLELDYEPSKTCKFDVVDRPEHYNQDGIECIDAIKASMTREEFRGYLKGNFMKYAWRYTYKGKPLEDVKKAQWYLNKLIKEIEHDESKREKRSEDCKAKGTAEACK